MDISGLTQFQVDELYKADDLINRHGSFAITGVGDTSSVATKMESVVEKKGLRCRIHTANRSLALGSALIPTPLTILAGLGTAAFIGIHNLFTFNCDYVIIKCPVDHQVVCLYNK